MEHNSENKVQVLTAGGAAVAGRTSASTKKSKRKQKKKKSSGYSDHVATTTTPEEEMSGSVQTDRPSLTTITTTTTELENQSEAPSIATVGDLPSLEMENNHGSDDDQHNNKKESEDIDTTNSNKNSDTDALESRNPSNLGEHGVKMDDLYQQPPDATATKNNDLFWLFFCFLGIMASFVCYGLLLEYTTSGGRKLHELSFLFVTSLLYTITAAAGRYVRAETPTTIPPARFAILGLTSMGSTFCSVRSLRYVIYPIQVLAKSCKPVPVMLMGALMGKKYELRKYINVCMIVLGVALFMGGGDKGGKKHKDGDADSDSASPSQVIGIVLLFISLCFDGGTGAYEDKLMSVHSVQPFDLMYNIQLGKTILAGVSLLVLNQIHIFLQMCQEMGFLLVALGLSGAIGQVFIFVTIAKFGALTCSIIGLARKVTTLVASIYFYGHHLNAVQFSGLVISVASMVMNFWGKKKKGAGGGHGGDGHGGPARGKALPELTEEMQSMLDNPEGEWDEGDVELATSSRK